MSITMEGKYVTRDGQSVRIISTDGPSAEPIIGVVANDAETSTWRRDGKYYDDGAGCHLDLFEGTAGQTRMKDKPAPFGDNWEMHYDWDATGYPCFYLHGLSGDQKRDSESLDKALRMMQAAPALLEALQAVVAGLQEERQIFLDSVQVNDGSGEIPDEGDREVLAAFDARINPALAAIAKATQR